MLPLRLVLRIRQKNYDAPAAEVSFMPPRVMLPLDRPQNFKLQESPKPPAYRQPHHTRSETRATGDFPNGSGRSQRNLTPFFTTTIKKSTVTYSQARNATSNDREKRMFENMKHIANTFILYNQYAKMPG
ncbi:hypothetical protein TKK_0013517 [Trichogramma kaykai]